MLFKKNEGINHFYDVFDPHLTIETLINFKKSISMIL